MVNFLAPRKSLPPVFIILFTLSSYSKLSGIVFVNDEYLFILVPIVSSVSDSLYVLTFEFNHYMQWKGISIDQNYICPVRIKTRSVEIRAELIIGAIMKVFMWAWINSMHECSNSTHRRRYLIIKYFKWMTLWVTIPD